MIHTTVPFEEKQLTMNQLGKMIGKGFKEAHEDLMRVTGNMEDRINARMDERFFAVDKKFDSMQKSMDERFHAMQKSMDECFYTMQKSMDTQFKETNSRISKLHIEVQDIKDGYASKAEHNHLNARITRIERKTV